jgi:hypothetical protein
MGADSIRAFDAIQRFRSELWQIVDVANESYMAEIVANRWIQVKLDFMTDIAVFIFVLIAILLADQKAITIGALAMVISSGFSVNTCLSKKN